MIPKEGLPLAMNQETPSKVAADFIKKTVWRTTLSFTRSFEQSLTWTLAGIIGIETFFLSHSESMGKVLSPNGIRWGLVVFAFSILAGAMAKHMGAMISAGVDVGDMTKKAMESEEAKALLKEGVETQNLGKEISDPFLWPYSRLIKNAFEEGLKDKLASEKKFVLLFSIQLYFIQLHFVAAFVGFLILAFSVRG